jgi:hypothetical protein
VTPLVPNGMYNNIVVLIDSFSRKRDDNNSVLLLKVT